MEILKFDPSEQRDITVDLGVVPEPLSEIEFLRELAMCVASGAKWWGRRCAAMPVVYINFELPRWAVGHRLGALWTARPELAEGLDRLHMWNLRGQNADPTLLPRGAWDSAPHAPPERFVDRACPLPGCPGTTPYMLAIHPDIDRINVRMNS